MLHFTRSQIRFGDGFLDRLLAEAHQGRMLYDLRPDMPEIKVAEDQSEIDGIVAAIKATGKSPPPPTLPANFLNLLPKPPKECHE